MKIGFIIYGSLDTLSGGYLYDRKLVEHVLSQGDHVEIISLPWRNYLFHLGDNLSPTLARRLAGLRPDILIQDELNHPSLFWLNRRLSKTKSYPIVSIVHHLLSSEERPMWQNNFYGWVERKYLQSVDGFIYNSHTTRKVVESLLGDVYPGVVAHPGGDRLTNSIADDEIVARASEPGVLRLIFLGNLTPRKGFHVLVDALQLLPKDAWQLTVVGRLDLDHAYTRLVHRQVNRARLEESIDFMGPLGKEDLPKYLARSHAMVVPSSYEGFGIAYLEGMGFGLPAIASTAGAAKEIIEHGVNGFLMPPGDAKALAGFIRQLWLDRELLAAMSLAARRRFTANPTWEETVSRIRNFLQSLVE